jgi:hypothetical protein
MYAPAPVAVAYGGGDNWPAREWREGHEWREREWRRQEWREHEWRERGRWGSYLNDAGRRHISGIQPPSTFE